MQINETKTIKAGSQLIYQTIYNQSGTLEKALLEYIMNSADAGASRIDINLSDNGFDYSIIDNGNGFGDKSLTIEEKKMAIEETFGHLGFDHGTDDENYRKYGKFGIGRAQLWAFSKNTWHTHEFIMDVDIKNKGMDYNIRTSEDSVEGCKIVGQFYEKMTLNDILHVKMELKKLATYAPIDIYFNGEKINKKLSELKNDYEIPNVRISINRSTDLKVYNQGVFVRSYPNHLFGKGGIVSSEIGHSFELNLARNDILQSKCKLWKKISKVLKADLNHNLTKIKLTDEERKNLIHSFASGSLDSLDDLHEFIKKPLFKCINNKYVSFKKILSSSITVANRKSDPLAEHIQHERTAIVLMEDFVNFLDISSPEDIEERIKFLCDFYVQKFDLENRHNFLRVQFRFACEVYGELKLKGFKFTELKTLKSGLNSSHMLIKTDKLTKKQNSFIKAVNMTGVNGSIVKAVNIANDEYCWAEESKRRKRVIKLGKSETAYGWTDSKSYIGVNVDLLNELDRFGMVGALQIVETILHEYLHEDSSLNADEHDHSYEFYKKYHDATLRSPYMVYNAAHSLCKHYAKNLNKADIKVPKSLNDF